MRSALVPIQYRCVAAPSREATGNFLIEYDGIHRIHRSDIVEVRWYRIQSDDCPIGQLPPHIVSIEPFPGLPETTQVWPIRRRRVPRHPPRPRSGKGDGGGQEEALPLEEGEASADEAAFVDGAHEDEEMFKALEEALLDGQALDLEAFGISAADLVSEEGGGDGSAEQPAAAAAASAATPPPDAAAVAQEAPDQARERHAGAPRKGADVTMHCPGGSISYYQSKQAFEAVCDNPAHGRCVATRTCRAKGMNPDGFSRGGRPVGFLAAWLAAGEGVGSKPEHWQLFETSAEVRLQSRRRVAEVASGRTLLGRERPLEPGEPEEPTSLAGYL